MKQRLICVVGIALVLVLAFAMSGAVEAGSSGPERLSYASNVRVIEARPVPGTFKGVLLKLPQLRVYDREGRLLRDDRGYRSELKAALAAVLAGQGTPDDSRRLSTDLALLLQDSKPLDRVPAGADFTLVEYWATWCKPCQALSRDLAEVLGKHPKLRFNLIHVDASETGREGPSSTSQEPWNSSASSPAPSPPRREALSLETARRVGEYLYRARENPDLKFAEPG